MKAFDTDILTEILAGNPAYAERIANVPLNEQSAPIVAIADGRFKMNAIVSVVKNGRVEVDVPSDWPDGTPVRVEPGLNGQTKYDDERPETPEEIEEWIRRFREIEPIEMTPEEEAAWLADRKMQKEFDNSEERVRRIEEIFK